MARQIVQQQPFSCPEDIFERVKGFGVKKCARMAHAHAHARTHAPRPKNSHVAGAAGPSPPRLRGRASPPHRRLQILQAHGIGFKYDDEDENERSPRHDDDDAHSLEADGLQGLIVVPGSLC